MNIGNRTKEHLINGLHALQYRVHDLHILHSEQKKIEEILKFERNQLLSIFDCIDEPVYAADPDTYEILFANNILKHSFGDIVGKRCYRVFQDLESPCPFCTNKYIFGENIGKTYIWEFQNKINQRWYHCIDKAIQWPDDRMVRYEMAIDITERKQAEEALRKSEFRYRRTFDSMKDAIHVVDADLRFTLFNESFKQWDNELGLKVDVIGRTVFEIFPFLSDKVHKEYQKVFETGEVVITEEVTQIGSREFITETRKIPIFEEGKVVRIMTVIRNITERKRTEEALKYRIELQKIITTLSTNFINLAPNKIDREINIALGVIGEFAGVDRSYIFLTSEDRTKVDNTHEWCAPEIESQSKRLKNIPVDSFPWFAKKILGFETIYIPCVAELLPEAGAIKKELQFENVQSLIVVPLVYNGSVVGFLGFDSVCEKKTWPEEIVALLKIAGVTFINALERKRAQQERERLNKELLISNKRLKQLALRDPHTGLYNHRYLEEVIESEFQRAKRYGDSLSVIILDVDYFKSINEAYGHQFGDLVLKQLARQLKKAVRRYDTVVRFGGEEFIVLSPGTDRATAIKLAQRILNAVNLYDFGNKKHTVKLNLSMSVVSYPEDRLIKGRRSVKIISAGIDLINLGDRILNKVKEAGGNKIYSSAMGLRVAEEKDSYSEGEEFANTQLLKDKIEKLTKQANQSLIESVFAFAKTIKLKDHYTGEHVERTVQYVIEIADALFLSREEVEHVKQAAILHDLGKIGINEEILHKKSMLTKMEFNIIKTHPQIGVDIIRPIHMLHDLIPSILYHHERWDGKGYPSGLKGEEIPLGARIVALADVYQALISDRPYRKAYSKEDAFKIISDGAGTQFDPKVADVLLKLLKQK